VYNTIIEEGFISIAPRVIREEDLYVYNTIIEEGFISIAPVRSRGGSLVDDKTDHVAVLWPQIGSLII
jgi:hypothetical protein